MKNIKTYSEYNEGLKSKLLGASLAGSMILSNPDVSGKQIPSSIELPAQDGVSFYRFIDTMSSKGSISDSTLNSILIEIKSHLKDHDSSNYKELFQKLSSHINTNYNYRITNNGIPPKDSINSLKSKGLTIAEILGWLGSICLAICGMPQAWMSYKDKNSHGISWAFLLLWAFGELFALSYVANNLDGPLLLNYGVNILIIAIILYYKVSPKELEESNESIGGWLRKKMNSDEETAEGIFRQLPRLDKNMIEMNDDFNILHSFFKFTLDEFNIQINNYDPFGSDEYNLYVDDAKIKASKKICKKIFNEVKRIYYIEVTENNIKSEEDKVYIRKDAKKHFNR